MKWTTKKPTKEGWYWYQYKYTNQPYIFHVFIDIENHCLVLDNNNGCLIEVGEGYEQYGGAWSDTAIPEPEK